MKQEAPTSISRSSSLPETEKKEKIIEKIEEHVVLNERQKELLRELGLPEKYDELNDSQKDGIVMIEKALVYLEDKYPQKFEYDGYVAGGIDGQYVTVKVTDSCPEEIVTVQIYKNNGQYEMVDDYENFIVAKEATEEMEDFLSNYFNPADIQVYIYVYEVQDGDTAPQRAIGVPDMMINGLYTEEEVKTAAMEYAEWMKNVHHRKAGVAEFRLYSVENYEQINEFNYTDYFGEEEVRFKVNFQSDEPAEIKEY